MIERRVAVALLTTALTGAGALASADEGVIEYRQSVYSAIGGHTNAIAAILKREVPHTGDLPTHARGIARLAPMTMHLFPEGSGDGRTKAREAIWQQPEQFAERREDFIAAAERLGDNADAEMGEFVAAFREVGGTCKACHDDFKAD